MSKLPFLLCGQFLISLIEIDLFRSFDNLDLFTYECKKKVCDLSGMNFNLML